MSAVEGEDHSGIADKCTEAGDEDELVLAMKDNQTSRSGESKQEVYKKPAGSQESKRQTTLNKESLGHMVPDLEEEEVFRDYAMLSVSMVTAVAAATLKNCPLYEHLSQTARGMVCRVLLQTVDIQ